MGRATHCATVASRILGHARYARSIMVCTVDMFMAASAGLGPLTVLPCPAKRLRLPHVRPACGSNGAGRFYLNLLRSCKARKNNTGCGSVLFRPLQQAYSWGGK